MTLLSALATEDVSMVDIALTIGDGMGVPRTGQPSCLGLDFYADGKRRINA